MKRVNTGQWRRWWRERYDLVRGMFVNFLSLWMVCARVTLIWGILRGGKGSIRPKVRFENSAYGHGLRLGLYSNQRIEG